MSDNEGAKSSRDVGTTLVPVLAQIPFLPPAPLVPWVALPSNPPNGPWSMVTGC